MEYKNILELWDRFEQSSVTEMTLDFHGTHFALKRGSRSESSEWMEQPQMTRSPEIHEFSELSLDSTDHKEKTAQDAEAPAGQASETAAAVKEVRAPLVGTFYRAPAPDEKPYVEIGQSVKKGDVIGIIEAMKLMNEVTASEDGVVTEILAEDGSLVGFDDPLIRLQ